jgi:hypothetical protein
LEKYGISSIIRDLYYNFPGVIIITGEIIHQKIDQLTNFCFFIYMDLQKEVSASISAPIVDYTTTSELTIVRLKRKRNEEPLDALGIE